MISDLFAAKMNSMALSSGKMMKKFYNRQEELKALFEVSSNIGTTNGQLSVLVGKRRVGKTRLLREAFVSDKLPKTLYFFISRKSDRNH